MIYTGIGAHVAQKPPGSSNSRDNTLRTKVNELERRLNRAELANQALWELLRNAAKLSPDILETLMKEIDLRDGIEDDRITSIPLRCPSCKRVSSSKNWKCLYCGLEFERGAY